MIKKTTLTIIGLFLTFIATIMLCKGLLLTNRQINQLSGTYFNRNDSLKESLENNRWWAGFGLALLFLGFIFQSLATISPNRGHKRNKDMRNSTALKNKTSAFLRKLIKKRLHSKKPKDN